MAAKRIAQSSINWSSLAERVPPAQRLNFNQFKSKSDKYLRSVITNPESAPKIDWAFYKSRITVPGLVDTFQKNYESIKIPYPPDNLTSQVVAQEGQVKTEIQQFKSASDARINEHQKAIEHLKSLLPYEDMTMEDYRDAFPDLALDAINKPTFWPHKPEEQLDYNDGTLIWFAGGKVMFNLLSSSKHNILRWLFEELRFFFFDDIISGN